MQKYVVRENGIGYILGEEGLYYPDLRLPEETHYPIGRYGRMREGYLKEYRKGVYLELLLNEHLHQTDEECFQRIEYLMKQMKEKQGVTEKLKSENQMQWVGLINNIRYCAEEVVLAEFVYV